MLPSFPVIPSLPAIGPTPYGNFGPTTPISFPGLGKGATFVRGLDYRNPNDRSFALTVDVSMLNLPTLPARMHEHLLQALIFHVRDVAEAIIVTAQASLVPKHGYDTGLLKRSLTSRLAEHLLATGVYYDLFSEEAHYWRWVEFGHWIAHTNKFWPGYHYLENAIRLHESRVRSSVREAWADTIMKLAGEARAPDPRKFL